MDEVVDKIARARGTDAHNLIVALRKRVDSIEYQLKGAEEETNATIEALRRQVQDRDAQIHALKELCHPPPFPGYKDMWEKEQKRADELQMKVDELAAVLRR